MWQRKTLLLAFLLAAAISLRWSSPTTAASPAAGKKLFYQRCSVCHLPAVRDRIKSDPKPYGPRLNGLVHDSNSAAQAKQTIQKGVPGSMPGFQYGLASEEIDSIVAYLMTFK